MLVVGKSLIRDLKATHWQLQQLPNCQVVWNTRPQDSLSYGVLSETWTGDTHPNRRSISAGLLSFLCLMEIHIDTMNNIFLFLTIVIQRMGPFLNPGFKKKRGAFESAATSFFLKIFCR